MSFRLPPAADVVRSATRVTARRRRPIAAALLAIAVLMTVSTLRPSPAGTAVVVSSRPLAAGTVLAADDLTTARWGAAVPPSGMFVDTDAVLGKRLTAPVSAGEPITVPRVAGGPLAAAGSSDVAYPVRLADGQVADLLSPGTVVDVIAATDHGEASVVATAASVLAVPPVASGASSFDGVLIVLSVSPATATRLAAAAAVGPLSVAVRP